MKGEVKQVNGKRVASGEYRSWQMMKNRCLNPNATDYAYYGARGITLDIRWLEFSLFLEGTGRRPTQKHTLERIDGAKGYFRCNCVWATRAQQARNREYCKITIASAQLIRNMYADGLITQKALGKLFGVSQRTVCLIVRNEAWV